MPARALDHLVIGTPDLERLAGEFEALGFRVGSRNRHPFGTENRLIQLADQTFLELIALGEGARVPPHQPGQFSFGAFVAEAIARAPGLSMLVLKSEDARADAADFASHGLGQFAPFHFARQGRGADGEQVEVAFTLAFAQSEHLAECGFFLCQQHAPENFWSPAMQSHANGARGISRVTLVAENPSDHHIFLGGFARERVLSASSSGIALDCGATRVEIVTPETFLFLYGVEARASTPHFAGFGLALAEPMAVAGQAVRMGLAIRMAGEACIIEPRPDFLTAIRLDRTGF